MKWGKFEKIFGDNPWLQMHIGSPALVSLPLNVPAGEALRALKEYVRTKMDYIAFRPLEGLDLSSTNVEAGERIKDPRYRNVPGFRGQSTRYTLRFHIEGPDGPFERARYVEDSDSIFSTIVKIVEWHQKYWALRGCPLRMGAIVKDVMHYNSVTNFGREHLEVFVFPENFDLEPFRVRVAA